MINISKDEISDKMFFVRVEDRNQPIAVIKVADLLEKAIKKNDRQGDLISREALRNVILNDHKLDGVNANWEINRILVHIKNAPTVESEITEQDIKDAIKQGYVEGYEMAKAKYENSQGCETCDYRIFTEKFVDGIADVMNQYGIKSIEELQKILEPYCKIARENKEFNEVKKND